MKTASRFFIQAAPRTAFRAEAFSIRREAPPRAGSTKTKLHRSLRLARRPFADVSNPAQLLM
jgi:hypothetical protein